MARVTVSDEPAQGGYFCTNLLRGATMFINALPHEVVENGVQCMY